MSVVKSYNHTSSLQKNQVYNWYDRYKPKQQLKTYLLKKYLKTSTNNIKKNEIKDDFDSSMDSVMCAIQSFSLHPKY